MVVKVKLFIQKIYYFKEIQMKNALGILIAVSVLSVGGYALAQGKSDSKQEAVKVSVEVGNKICPVSGEKIDGKMGEAVKYEYKGKIYNLCCSMCLKDFKKDPEKYSKMADEQMENSEEMGKDADGDDDHDAKDQGHQH